MVWRLKSDRSKVSSFFIINLGISDWFMGCYMLIIASVDVSYRGTYILYADSWRSSVLCQFAGILAMLSSEVNSPLPIKLLLLFCLYKSKEGE